MGATLDLTRMAATVDLGTEEEVRHVATQPAMEFAGRVPDAQAGRLLDIELLDHLIIGRGRWISMRALGALGQGPPTIL